MQIVNELKEELLEVSTNAIDGMGSAPQLRQQ